MFPIVIYNSNRTEPKLRIYGKRGFIDMTIEEIEPCFFLYHLEYDSMDVCYTPTLGSTKNIVFQKNKECPFGFVDLSEEDELAPFPVFYDFFTKYLPSIDFSFGDENLINKIYVFMKCFPEKYFLWTLIYVTNLPLRRMHCFDKEISSFLLENVVPFIKNELQPPSSPEYNAFLFESNFNLYLVPRRQMITFMTAEYYIETLLNVLTIQIGAGLSFLLCVAVDTADSFPLTLEIPSFDSPHLSLNEKIVNEIIDNMPKTNHLSIIAALCVFNKDSELNFSSLTENFDFKHAYGMVAEILNYRMLHSKPDANVLKVLTKDDIFNRAIAAIFSMMPEKVPFDWVTTVANLFDLDITSLSYDSLTLALKKSLSVPPFNIVNGSIIMNSAKVANGTVIMPGCVVLDKAVIKENVVLMPGSIVCKGVQVESDTIVNRCEIVRGNGAREYYKIGRDIHDIVRSSLGEFTSVIKKQNLAYRVRKSGFASLEDCRQYGDKTIQKYVSLMLRHPKLLESEISKDFDLLSKMGTLIFFIVIEFSNAGIKSTPEINKALEIISRSTFQDDLDPTLVLNFCEGFDSLIENGYDFKVIGKICSKMAISIGKSSM